MTHMTQQKMELLKVSYRGMGYKNMNDIKRHRILMKQDNKCFYCERALTLEQSTIEHIIPKSRGGRKGFKNIVVACNDCNTLVGNFMSIEELDAYYDRVAVFIGKKERLIQIRFPWLTKKTIPPKTASSSGFSIHALLSTTGRLISRSFSGCWSWALGRPTLSSTGKSQTDAELSAEIEAHLTK